MRRDYDAFSSGELDIAITKKSLSRSSIALLPLLKKYPVTLTLFCLSILGFFLNYLGFRDIIDMLVIQNVDSSVLAARLNLPERISTEEYLAHGQYWRLLTPIFLHFSWLHIVFNMLWLWELGRRIEVQGGSLHLLSIVVFIGIASNLYQAASTPLATFGGMSGVIYGLLGYCAVFQVLAPFKRLQLPGGIYIIMLASLLLGYLGVFDFLALMANTAHLSGLISGLLIAVPAALIMRASKGS